MLGKGTLEERQAAMRRRMEARQAAVAEDLKDRKKCISCKHRYARKYSAFCSRCSSTDLQNQLRDTLPGTIKPEPQYQVYATENGGSRLVGERPTLTEALTLYERNKFSGAFGIKLPDGKWHKFSKEEEDDNILALDEDAETSFSNKSEVPKQQVLEDIVDKKYYTRQQVSELVGISCTTISRWERKGKIPLPRRSVHNNQCLYTDEDLKAIKNYKDMEYVPPSISLPTGVAALPRAMKKIKLNRRAESAIAKLLG